MIAPNSNLKPCKRHRQLELKFKPRGGKRKGAGRKPKGARACVAHRPRTELRRRMPLHVTMRMRDHVWNLRSRRSFCRLESALWAASNRFWGSNRRVFGSGKSHPPLDRGCRPESAREGDEGS